MIAGSNSAADPSIGSANALCTFLWPLILPPPCVLLRFFPQFVTHVTLSMLCFVSEFQMRLEDSVENFHESCKPCWIFSLDFTHCFVLIIQINRFLPFNVPSRPIKCARSCLLCLTGSSKNFSLRKNKTEKSM